MGIFEDKKIIGKGKVKQGAIVGQDHGFIKWGNENIIFDVYDFMKKRKILIADGYGNLKRANMYGNGCLYVDVSDIIMLSEEEMPESHYDNDKDLIKSKDMSDYYDKHRTGIEKDIKRAVEMLNPYNGNDQYKDRLRGCSNNLIEIAALMDALSEEF